jgi:hypothetical protein
MMQNSAKTNTDPIQSSSGVKREDTGCRKSKQEESGDSSECNRQRDQWAESRHKVIAATSMILKI